MPKKYTTIKLPVSLHEKLKQLAEEEGRKLYVLVEEMYNRYIQTRKDKYRFKEYSRLDKASWYCYKLASSVGSFRENPSSDNYDKLMRTIEQVRTRLKVDTSQLEDAVKKYYKLQDTDSLIYLNDSAKLVIGDIIVKLLLEPYVKNGK